MTFPDNTQPGFSRTLNTRLLHPLASALRHPNLIWPAITGTDSATLLKQHVAIHLKDGAKFETKSGPLDPVEFTCHAIDVYSHSCFKLQYLYPVCRCLNPRKVVETGVHHGISTAFILSALKRGGAQLYSIDLPNAEYKTDAEHRQIDLLLTPTPGFVVPEDLKVNWRLELGDSMQRLPALLESIGQIDLFHHDSMHTYECMTFEYETAWPYLNRNGILLSDDVSWSRAFQDFCHRHKTEYRIHKGIGMARKLD